MILTLAQGSDKKLQQIDSICIHKLIHTAEGELLQLGDRLLFTRG